MVVWPVVLLELLLPGLLGGMLAGLLEGLPDGELDGLPVSLLRVGVLLKQPAMTSGIRIAAKANRTREIRYIRHHHVNFS